MTDRQAPETSLSLLADICRERPAPDTWARFVGLYGPAVAGWCRRRGLNETDAEEVAQAVFCLLVQRLPAFQYDPARGRFRSWLRTLTLREVCSFLRAEARHRLAPILDSLPAADGGLLQGLIERDLLNTAFEHVKANCDPVAWKAFAATKLHDRPPADVAASLRIPVAEVYRAAYRIKLLVAAEIKRLENTP